MGQTYVISQSKKDSNGFLSENYDIQIIPKDTDDSVAADKDDLIRHRKSYYSCY